ncbi:YcjF family protein [Prochlorothrix hollandica]|uniref:GTP-binding protein n=1 Tax=Prochlorothrix hollandica PCC 9006 = CALU 1027 TaxID=317619 RepID=A0A0M2PY47_PROHO|nr:GTP-binding protein [Prochlorothrix hollandica]KKJ01351.1 GTP-binding protein [Prochlorothrix hollandica PCC 9006 = CALU 1027]
MPLRRQLTLIIGLLLILGMALWLINALGNLYWYMSYTSPFLAGVLLLLLIVLFGCLIVAFVYYGNLLRPNGRRPAKVPPQIPAAKAEAAGETLKAIQKQVAQIQDEVARQALLSRSRQIAADLRRGEWRVAVFGTGSAGKTSLINALVGDLLGEVGATMGTTQDGQVYPMGIQGLDRDILLTDTPGILEAGAEGEERAQRARQLAVEADLLLFVVDNDLQRSELIPLRALAKIGKRSILVFNKIDLYTAADQDAILDHLCAQVAGMIAPEDVVTVAANPRSVQLPTGELYEPAPEVLPLLRRLVAVLRAEGEDLIADNILLQSQRLGDEARSLIDAQRLRQAEQVVDRFQWISAGVIAVTPLPVVDLLGTAAVNAQMVVDIGKIYGCELNLDRGRDLAFSLARTLTSLGLIKGSLQLMTTLSTTLQLNITTIAVGRIIQGISAAYLTRIAGRSFIEYFRHNQDWGDGGITEVVQRQFQLNRKDAFMKGFIQDAMAKVVKPLADQFQDEPPAVPPKP